jgi:hypothetical protein
VSEQSGSKLKKILPIVAVLLVVGAGVAVTQSAKVKQWLGLHKVEFPGDRASFRPVENYYKVARLAGSRVEVRRIDARFVRSDGTLNLDADGEPMVEYHFVRKRKKWRTKMKNTSKRRRRRRRTNTNLNRRNRTKYKYQLVKLTLKKSGKETGSGGCGGSAQVTPYISRSKTRIEEKGCVAKSPSCRFSDLWEKAAKAGMPTDAPATIIYTCKGYDFSIPGKKETLHFDTSCELTKQAEPTP